MTVNRLIAGFLAGIVGILVFHQGTFLVLYWLGYSPNPPYNMRGVPPFGVPWLISNCFWSGLWGIVLTAILDRLPASLPRAVWGLILGVVGPAMVVWLVVSPLKGGAVMAGWDPGRLLIGALVHAMFGLGVAVSGPAIARMLEQRARVA